MSFVPYLRCFTTFRAYGNILSKDGKMYLEYINFCCPPCFFSLRWYFPIDRLSTSSRWKQYVKCWLTVSPTKSEIYRLCASGYGTGRRSRYVPLTMKDSFIFHFGRWGKICTHHLCPTVYSTTLYHKEYRFRKHLWHMLFH